MNQEFNFRVIDSIENIYDDNVDVEVVTSGKTYVATFFTLENVKSIMQRHKDTGECLGGLYFNAANMIIVKDLHESTIRLTIEDLIKEDELDVAFQRVSM